MYEIDIINVKNIPTEEKMKKKSPKNSQTYFKSHFYEENKVFITLAKIVGGLPISMDKTGKLNFKILSGITIYSFSLLLIAAACTGYILKNEIHILQNFELDFDDRILMYGAVLYQGLYIMPLISFLEGNKIAKYFSSWIDFEQNYFKITKKHLNYKTKRLQYVTVFIMCVDSIFAVYFFYLMTVLQHEKYAIDTPKPVQMLFIIIDFYYLWIIHSVLGTWIFVTLGTRKTAKILLNDLQDVKLRTYQFDDLYSLWLDFKNLTEDLGNAFSSTYIYYLTYMFMMLMGSMYSLIISIATPGSETNYAFLGCTVLISAFFGLIADCAHKTSLQVGTAFTNVLLGLLSNEKDPAMRRDIKWFIQTIALNPPNISLAGYFVLNREFNVSMLGTLVTYIVIVLQFRSTSSDKALHAVTTMATE